MVSAVDEEPALQIDHFLVSRCDGYTGDTSGEISRNSKAAFSSLHVFCFKPLERPGMLFVFRTSKLNLVRDVPAICDIENAPWSFSHLKLKNSKIFLHKALVVVELTSLEIPDFIERKLTAMIRSKTPSK